MASPVRKINEVVSLKKKDLREFQAQRDHPLFDAAPAQLQGASTLFYGPSGGGKTAAAECLGIEENWPILLEDTPYADIDVRIRNVDVDLSKLLAIQELWVDLRLEKGDSKKYPGLLADFISRHGFSEREEFRASEAERKQAIRSGKGCITLYQAVFDEIDRTTDVGVTNAVLKPLQNVEHYLPHDSSVKYMNLQGISTSNSTCAPQQTFIACRGLDVAVANRHTPFWICNSSFSAILINEYDEDMKTQKQREVVGKLGSLAEDVSREIHENGAFGDLGEVSLRQARYAVESFLFTRFDPERAARMLFKGVGNDEDSEKANLLIARYFGSSVKPEGRQKLPWQS